MRLAAAEVWPDDAALGAWLAADPSLLGEAIGLPLASAAAGPMPKRLTATASDGSTVSIVAEVRSTSHEALASVVSAAALDGTTVVWIAGEVDSAHGASLSWLNRRDDARFYLVRVEGARIGPSSTAALMELVVRPPRGEDVGRPVDVESWRTPERRAEDHTPKG